MTSAVTGRPLYCARAIICTARALDMWQKCARTPVCSMSNKSRAMAFVSAVSGIPAKPKRVLIAPSCAQPFPARPSSSACKNIVRPQLAAYSMARRIIKLFETGFKALLTPTQLPYFFNSAISLSCSPLSPAVSAPRVTTFA